MNVNNFYKYGFDEWQMPQWMSQAFMGQLLIEEWIDHPVYKGVPSWSINKDGEAQDRYVRADEQGVNAKSLKVVPELYRNLINDLFAEEHYSAWFKDTCGYNTQIKFIDVWNGSDNLGYHWDGVEDHDIGFLIYFTEQDIWNEEWEAYLELGERDWPDGEINTRHKAYPANGKVILLNNMNPRFVHSVRQLTNNNVNRYTINAGISVWN